ncbi:MAG: hypothetical protein IJV83_05210 [Clostridia bacterium]|nr:hypothetical protein [Clostridia bacterium]
MKIRIDLTKKDADIAAFKMSLPKGEWSKTVVQIMNAAMRDRVADIPMQFTIEALDEKIPTKISLPEKLAERFKEKFGYKKGNFSTGIKIEIRKCIRKNLKISSVKRFSSAEITAAFDEAFHRISEKGEMLDGRRDKNERVQREYRWAFNAMLDTLTNSIKKGS